jgi:type II restriction enzyme
VQIGKEILGKIDMPEHKSARKELDRGRLLFLSLLKVARDTLITKYF